MGELKESGSVAECMEVFEVGRTTFAGSAEAFLEVGSSHRFGEVEVGAPRQYATTTNETPRTGGHGPSQTRNRKVPTQRRRLVGAQLCSAHALFDGKKDDLAEVTSTAVEADVATRPPPATTPIRYKRT